MLNEVEIYTDGACSGNPGAGGYCAILMCDGREKVISGAFEETTNNRMEVLAAIEGLKALKRACKVTLYSDSAYLVNAISENWLVNWKRRNWRTADNKDVKNRDLWEQLDALLATHEVTFVKVKGHSDNAYNNRCDEVARAAISELKKRTED